MRYILDPPSLYKFLLPKTELGLILLCYFYNLTVQLLAAWLSQVSSLLLPDLPLSVWVQDRSNMQLLYCVIWQPLYSAPAWIYWAEQTVVCQEVSPQKKHWLSCTSLPSCFQQQHSQKGNDCPSVTWTWINRHWWPGCSISGLVSAPSGLRAIWNLSHETWLLFAFGFLCQNDRSWGWTVSQHSTMLLQCIC